MNHISICFVVVFFSIFSGEKLYCFGFFFSSLFANGQTKGSVVQQTLLFSLYLVSKREKSKQSFANHYHYSLRSILFDFPLNCRMHANTHMCHWYFLCLFMSRERAESQTNSNVIACKAKQNNSRHPAINAITYWLNKRHTQNFVIQSAQIRLMRFIMVSSHSQICADRAHAGVNHLYKRFQIL